MDFDDDLNDNSDCDIEYTPSTHPYVLSQDKLSYSLNHTHPVYPRPEVKMVDVGIGSPNTSWSITRIGVVACYNDDLLNSTTVNGFTGNQATMKSISWNFLPALPVAQANVPGTIRYSIVWDRQPNGVLPAYSDIFNSTGTAFVLNPFAHQEWNNRQRFIILKTFVYPSPLNAGANYETGKLNLNMLTTYSTNQTVATVPQTGALLGAACTSNDTLSFLFGYIRVRYYDN